MSVLITLRIKADPSRLQEVMASNEARWQAINSRAKEAAPSIIDSWPAPTGPDPRP